VNAVSQVAALVGALTYLAVAPLEIAFFSRPWAQRFLRVHAHDLEDVSVWAFVVGCRNVLAGVGALVGLVVVHVGDPVVGRTVVLTVSAYMLLASLAMLAADLLGLWRPRGGSVVGTVGSSLTPLVALIAAAA
jgi:putative membrane protein